MVSYTDAPKPKNKMILNQVSVLDDLDDDF